MLPINNLIVGAGPAGLAIAAQLRSSKIEFELWEASNRLAHSWTRHYKRLHLHTVRDYSHLPFQKFPTDYPTFVSRQQIVDYCERYADSFKIVPRYGKEITQVLSTEGSWQVTDASGNQYKVKNLIVATGLNRLPNMPVWPGMDTYTGEIIHSRDYLEAQAFSGKKCLVVGMGNTGAEIALDLAENNIDTTISVRSALNIVPREAFGRPTQETALKLQSLPNWLQDLIGNLMKRITIGKLTKYGIQISSEAPLKQLRTTGKTPLIDLGTVEMIKKGKIKTAPDISGFKDSTVNFADGSSRDFDAVICATGYRSGIGKLIPEIKPYLDPYGNPKFAVGSGRWSGLYFLGFDNYRPGGILGIIRKDSGLIAEHIKHYRTPLTEVI